MAQHLLFSEHMTAKEIHRPIAETYLGQAHIAGTGPEGKTCRECNFWHVWKSRKLAGGGYREDTSRLRLFWKASRKDALRAEKSALQSPDSEQGQSAHSAFSKGVPAFRSSRTRPSSEEGR